MTGRHRMWDADGDRDVDVDVPVSGGENVMVPVIRAVVHRVGDPNTIILQRRDIALESVRGRLEIPGGRWRAGESPDAAVRREILEETGLVLTTAHGVDVHDFGRQAVAGVRPLIVASGSRGAFPAIHVVVVAEADGEPRSRPGETIDVRWWHVGQVVDLLDTDIDAFIPSTAVALRAYLDMRETVMRTHRSVGGQ